ncbi:hypothetical protein C0J52_21316 [Blattella germanica]|nr:hypothetical protein C0J52_21316 [Blattella germanica]
MPQTETCKRFRVGERCCEFECLDEPRPTDLMGDSPISTAFSIAPCSASSLLLIGTIILWSGCTNISKCDRRAILAAVPGFSKGTFERSRLVCFLLALMPTSTKYHQLTTQLDNTSIHIYGSINNASLHYYIDLPPQNC